jgi:hypothetical protein
MQNTSHAVMAQRASSKDGLDDFPTPPWATRAMLSYVLDEYDFSKLTCLEPACNRGYMSEVLKEYFSEVYSSDIFPYGYGQTKDFLESPYKTLSYDWVITNPPFKEAQKFVERSLHVARHGVAILARTVFLESIGRYNEMFSINPPSVFAQYSERVPMVRGRLDKKASTATGYGWFIWEKNKQVQHPKLVWIPPCRKILEKDSDYSGLLNRAMPSFKT